MDLTTALNQRRHHRQDPADWAARCHACDELWPCRAWRTARAVVLITVRRAFQVARQR